MSIPHLIEKTHFDPKKPENHNIYISNLSRGHAMVYDGSKKWVVKTQDEVIEDLIGQNEYRLEDWVTEGSKKYPKAMKKFEKYVEKRDEKGVPEIVRKEIKMMLYNNRDLIISNDDVQEVD
jgi:cupin superfamily acireductone dioxygenase involved in methionine salvage